jgi:hypothetical protein
MSFKGICLKQVEFRNTVTETQFSIKEGTGTNLLGMDWIQKNGLAKSCLLFLESLKGQAVLGMEQFPALDELLAYFIEFLGMNWDVVAKRLVFKCDQMHNLRSSLFVDLLCIYKRR